MIITSFVFIEDGLDMLQLRIGVRDGTLKVCRVHSLLELNILATFHSCLPMYRSQYNFYNSKILDTFLRSNFHNKAKNPADDVGQLVTYYFCDALPTAPPSHMHAFETLFFRLMWIVGGIIVFFGV